MDLNEKFYGYTMNDQGQYPEPVVINSKDQLSEFLVNNVTKHHELRITDTDDFLVMYVVKQTLVFPIPNHGKIQNHWDVKTNRFVND